MNTSHASPTADEVRATLVRHEPRYARREPKAATETLLGVIRLLPTNTRSILDVGGGTGLMGQALADLMRVRVTAIDVFDRFLPGLTIATRRYDATKIEETDDAFDAVTMLNVLHHVRPADRVSLLKECLRVAPVVVVKDHLAASGLDHLRLAALDAIGNIPFGGMVRAWYLDRSEWADLATRSGARVSTMPAGSYRSGPSAAIFPNRLEVFMRFDREPRPSRADRHVAG